MSICVKSQSISGTITDSSKEPVPMAVVILQTADSVFVDVVTTDSSGSYLFDKSVKDGRLLVQHLAYQTKIVTFSNSDYSPCKNIVLTDKTTELRAIDVVAYAPVVTVKQGGSLVYNVAKAKEQKTVSSAFDLLKEIPGVKLSGSNVSLIGASNLTLIVDGKASLMPNEQVAEMLKSMSANDVRNIEVMYRAPAKYGVHGAVINIVKDKTKKGGSPWAMELAPNFEQEFYSSYGGRLNTSFKGDKLYLDFLASGRDSKYHTASFEETRFYIDSWLQPSVEFGQHSLGKVELDNGKFRLAADYAFSDKNELSMYYYVKYDKYKIYKTVGYGYGSVINDDKNEILQNANLKWELYDFEFTADYLSYSDDDEQLYKGYNDYNLTLDYVNKSGQDINQGKVNLNYNREISDKCTLTAGMNGTLVRSKTKIDYLFNDDNGNYQPNNDSIQRNQQDEQRGGFYIETSSTLRDSIELSLTIETEYFNSDYDNNGIKTNLWREWNLFPSLSVTWPIRRSLFQLSLSTNKRYPAYWVVNPQSKQQTSYSYIIGNPQLKPETRYDANIAYILRKRYLFSAFCSYRNKYFCQLPYVDAANEMVIFQFTNFNKYIQSGIGAEVPVTVGFWNVEFSANLINQYYKHSNFHGNSFSRSKLCYALSANNTFRVSKSKPDLSLTMLVGYVSKCIQGTTDLNDKWDFDLGLRWAIRQNLVLTLSWTDILEKSTPWPMVTKFGEQYDYYKQKEYNNFDATLVWRINGFKPQKTRTINTSRIER